MPLVDHDPKKVARALRNLREKVCAYFGKPGHRCDCKFGADEKLRTMSERGSGCPELLAAASLLEAMTAEEHRRLCKRVITLQRDAVRAREAAAKTLSGPAPTAAPAGGSTARAPRRARARRSA